MFTSDAAVRVITKEELGIRLPSSPDNLQLATAAARHPILYSCGKALRNIFGSIMMYYIQIGV